MASQSDQLDSASVLIDPNQKEIPLYVTFHSAIIISLQLVRVKFLRNLSGFLQMSDHGIQGNKFLLVVLITLEIFLELTALFNDIHDTTMML